MLLWLWCIGTQTAQEEKGSHEKSDLGGKQDDSGLEHSVDGRKEFLERVYLVNELNVQNVVFREWEA